MPTFTRKPEGTEQIESAPRTTSSHAPVERQKSPTDSLLYLQRAAGNQSVQRVLRTSGSALDPILRTDMERRLGYDFSDVRVHSGPDAERSASEVSAEAYTVGNAIVFGRNRFAPGTHHGRQLIAHELTHVMQQSGTLQRQPDKNAPGETADPIDEKKFPDYAWHLVGSTFEGTKPGHGVIRAILAENAGIDRDLLADTTAEFMYRGSSTLGPTSYLVFRHPSRGVVARAFAAMDDRTDPKLWLKESHPFKVYVFSPHGSPDHGHYVVPLPLSSAEPRPLDMNERAAQDEWEKSLWPDHKHLAKGTMEWRLKKAKGASADYRGQASAIMEVKFTPQGAYRLRPVTFLQTVLHTKADGTEVKSLRMDLLSDDYDPFYGMVWRWGKGQWEPEPAPEGSKNAPSSKDDPVAYLYDEPSVPPTTIKMFETVAVVPSSGEVLGALRWGLGEGGKLYGATNADCTDAPSADFGKALEEFYATPATPGPAARKEGYDAILDGFAYNDATLTADHETQLAPIAAALKKDSKLAAVIGGFGDSLEPNAISVQRAKAVADHLKASGVQNMLKTSGFGDTWARFPKGANEHRNRRVQILLYDNS